MQPFILSLLLSFLLTRRCIKIILVFSLNITGPRQKLRGGVGFIWTASWGAEHPLMPVGKIFFRACLRFSSIDNRLLAVLCGSYFRGGYLRQHLFSFRLLKFGSWASDKSNFQWKTPLKRIWGCVVCCVDELQRLLKLWLVKRVAIGFHKTKMLLKIHTHYARHS